MRKGRVFSILLSAIFVSFGVLHGTSPWAAAQKLRVSKYYIATKVDSPEHPGLLILGAGETISKKGLVFKYDLQQDAEHRFSGYRYEASNLDSLQKGDRLLLFIRGIDLTNNRGETTLDLTGVRGGWMQVTIESVSHDGDAVVIGFQRPLKLQSGKELQSLRFMLRQGYLEEALPAAAPKS